MYFPVNSLVIYMSQKARSIHGHDTLYDTDSGCHVFTSVDMSSHNYMETCLCTISQCATDEAVFYQNSRVTCLGDGFQRNTRAVYLVACLTLTQILIQLSAWTDPHPHVRLEAGGGSRSPAALIVCGPRGDFFVYLSRTSGRRRRSPAVLKSAA